MGCEQGAVVIYLDTHVIAWLYSGELSRIPPSAKALIEDRDLLISPMVILELSYLHEIERLSVAASMIVEALAATIGLRVCSLPFHRLVVEAMQQKWTRDPFDRIIVANALCAQSLLLTKDVAILQHCPSAVWGE